MTECAFREQLSAYHDGDLAAVQAEEVRRHVASATACGCREELAALHTLVRDLRELAPGPVPPGGWGRLSARLDRRRARRWEWTLPMAALLLLGFALLLFRSAAPPAPVTEGGSPATVGPAPRPAEQEVPGIPFVNEASGRPTVVTVAPPGSAVRATRPPRPRFQTVALKASLPPPRVPTDLILAYGAEVEPIDRLLQALRRISHEPSGDRVTPRGEGDPRHEPQLKADDAVQGQIEALEALRADVMAELVIEAQARAAAPWK